MAGKSSLASEATVLSISKIIVKTCLLASVMILSRRWTLDEFGTYSQIQIIENLLISVLMLGLPSCIGYFIVHANTKEERQKFLSSYYTTSTVLGLLIGAISILILPLAENYFSNSVLGDYMLFVAVIPLTKILLNSIENLLVVYKRTDTVAIFSVAHSLCTVLTALATVLIPLRFREYMIIYLILECVFTLAVYIIINRIEGRLEILIDWKLIKKVLAFSIPLGLAGTAGILQAETDKLVIGFFLTRLIWLYIPTLQKNCQ